MFLRLTRALPAFAVAGLVAAGPAHAASCADTLVSTPQLTQFSALVQGAGLAPQVGTGTLTVFAPTNDALNRIANVTQMLAVQNASTQPDFPKLQTLVRAHLVGGLHPEDQMHGKVSLTTLAGTTLAIDGTGQRAITLSTNAAHNVNLSGMRLVSGVHVTAAPIPCDNGLIYPIDCEFTVLPRRA